MIGPATLAEMIDATRIDTTRAAIVGTLATLLKGVAVVGHPGKLDINDVVGKAVVAAPGVAIGYSRVREVGDVGGTFSAAVDWVAYIVVEDLVDRTQTPPRTTSRDIVGPAIGMQVLRILRAYDTASWGIGAIEPPTMETPPEFRPVFTLKTQENMTAIYAVTWTQALVQEGVPFFGFGPTPGAAPSQDDPDAIDFDLPDETPPEIDAVLSGPPGTPQPDPRPLQDAPQIIVDGPLWPGEEVP